MGLDMYAYVAARAGQRDKYYDQDLRWDSENSDWIVPEGGIEKPRELAYWRKHPNLHGWMEQLWIHKCNAEGKPIVEDANDWGSSFNGIELELTWEDLDELERAVKKRNLPSTSGFFFGDPADQHYYESDLAFIKNARAELFTGLRVFYNSSW
jgi:hypothetical protein